MMFFKKKINENYKNIYKEIMEVYFDYLNNLDNFCLEPKGISELLRYSLCNVMNLETMYVDTEIKDLSNDLGNKFNSIVNKYNINNNSLDYRRGLLEACVHCIEFSRKQAGFA